MRFFNANGSQAVRDMKTITMNELKQLSKSLSPHLSKNTTINDVGNNVFRERTAIYDDGLHKVWRIMAINYLRVWISGDDIRKSA